MMGGSYCVLEFASCSLTEICVSLHSIIPEDIVTFMKGQALARRKLFALHKAIRMYCITSQKIKL